jgi:hypothetical protein
MRQLFTQTMAGECGAGGGGDAVCTPQSMLNAHVGNSEPGLPQSMPNAHIGNSEPGLPSSQSSQSLVEENTLVSNEKKDSSGGEVAPRKGWRLPRRGTLSLSKGVEVALSAHMPKETAMSGQISRKPSNAAGIAAGRTVVEEGRGHVRTR